LSKTDQRVIEMIERERHAEREFPEIDQLVLRAFPEMTLSELAAAYREAAAQNLAEAEALKRGLPAVRQGASN
jgi:hypothetical protein